MKNHDALHPPQALFSNLMFGEASEIKGGWKEGFKRKKKQVKQDWVQHPSGSHPLHNVFWKNFAPPYLPPSPVVKGIFTYVLVVPSSSINPNVISTTKSTNFTNIKQEKKP